MGKNKNKSGNGTKTLMNLWEEFDGLVNRTVELISDYADEGTYYTEHCKKCPSMEIKEGKIFCNKHNRWSSCVGTVKCDFGIN